MPSLPAERAKPTKQSPAEEDRARDVLELRVDGLGLYVGESRDGMMDGFGQLFDNAERLIYEGCFRRNNFEGLGTLVLPDAAEVDCEEPWKDLSRVAAAVCSYEGDFSASLFEGKGTLRYTDGSRFFGSFRAGRAEGPGGWVDAEQMVVGVWTADLFVEAP